MTTRRWMVAVAFVAAWLAFVARAERLRGLGRDQMFRYVEQQRVRGFGDQAQSEAAARAGLQAAWHLQKAKAYNVEADFVESFQLAVLLTGLCLGGFLIYRENRRRVPPPVS